MEQHFLDVLSRHAAGLPDHADRISADLEAACLWLADALGRVEPPVRQELLALVAPRILALLGRKDAPPAAAAEQTNPNDAAGAPEGRNGAPPQDEAQGPQPMKLTPELLEWAKQQFSEEEVVAGLLEVQQTGGLELHEFFPELEREFGLNE